MPAQKKILFSFLLSLLVLSFFPKAVLAQVSINEFSSYGNSDWVEIYRTQSEDVSLYLLKDEAENTKPLSGDDCNEEFCVVDWSNRLNNAGDVIKLLLASDQSSPINQVAYGDRGDDVIAPEEGQSAGRSSDGGSSWIIFSSPTRGSSNETGTPAPTNTPTQTLTNTPVPTNTTTPSPTPASSEAEATYKINEVKDEEGNTLSSVKVYVDDNYLHHYAPETLRFCHGCRCDDVVDCGFGEHTIKLEKNNYQDWSEKKTINPGDHHEVNPVMKLSGSAATATPTPSASKTPTPTPPAGGPSATPTPTPTSSGEVLGATESAEASESSLEEEKEEEEESEKESKSAFFWPKILIGLGTILMIGASYPFWLPKLKKTRYNNKPYEEN